MRTRNVLVGTMIALAALALGQKPKAQPAATPIFELGVTEDQLYSEFGYPEKYLCVKAQRYVTREQVEKASANDTCRPIYSRKTDRNEYEIMVWLEEDTSQSRLHPVQRVKEVRFRFDKDMLAGDAIKDIKEAQQLCQASCSFSVAHELELVATPESGNPRFVFFPAKTIPGKVNDSTPMASAVLVKVGL